MRSKRNTCAELSPPSSAMRGAADTVDFKMVSLDELMNLLKIVD